MKKQFKKMRRGLGISGSTSNVPNIRIIGVSEGEEEQREIENLFEQIMKKNFSSLAKEIDFEEVQEAQRVLKNFPRRHIPKHIIITLFKIRREY